MTASRRPRIAILVGVWCAVICAACTWPIWYPDGVMVEAVKYEKSEFFRHPPMNLVSDLRAGDFDGDGARDILAIASDGAHLLAEDGREKRFVALLSPGGVWAARVVPGAADGRLRYAASLGSANTALFDDMGRMIWEKPGRGYSAPVPADADGDGRPEVIIDNGKGLEVLTLDRDAAPRGITTADRPYSFDAADFDGDGLADIVTQALEGRKSVMTVFFGGEGRQPKRWNAPHEFHFFSIARTGAGSGPAILILSNDAEDLVFLDSAGSIARRLKAPLGPAFARPVGSPLRVGGNDAGFVCVAVATGSLHRHMVYVYTAAGDLVYAESADDNADALLALSGSTARGSFLVGGRGVIWKYSEAGPSTSQR